MLITWKSFDYFTEYVLHAFLWDAMFFLRRAIIVIVQNKRKQLKKFFLCVCTVICEVLFTDESEPPIIKAGGLTSNKVIISLQFIFRS